MNKETALLERTRRGLRAVRERFTFRWLFVCNETCWVNSWRFNAYPFWDWDATGVWESGSGAMSLSRRAVNFLLQALEAGAESDLGGLLRDLPAAKILRAPLCIPYRADSWEPCLLAHGVSSPEAMRALHAKALRYETFIGCAPQQNGDSCECKSAPPIVTVGFPLAIPPPKLPHECRVFIQIAAYRESDLTNSLRDLFSKAADPTRLRVGICWQHTEDESLDEFANDSRVRIDAIPACEAKGLGWARSRAQLLYDGEEFNLQIDGHTRFIEGWDEVLIGMLAQTDSPKPLLTTYPKGFVPGKPLPPGKPLLNQCFLFSRKRHMEPISRRAKEPGIPFASGTRPLFGWWILLYARSALPGSALRSQHLFFRREFHGRPLLHTRLRPFSSSSSHSVASLRARVSAAALGGPYGGSAAFGRRSALLVAERVAQRAATPATLWPSRLRHRHPTRLWESALRRRFRKVRRVRLPRAQTPRSDTCGTTASHSVPR